MCALDGGLDGGIFGDLSNFYEYMAAGMGSFQAGDQKTSQLQNMMAQQQNYKAYQNDLGNVLGFTTAWNFAEPQKPEKPEQYGPWPPKMREWRYETRYAEGRADGWVPALRDPGARLLKVAGYLAVYPVVYLLISLLKGLFFAIS